MPERENDIPKNAGTSAITTDMENAPEQQEVPEPYVEKDPLVASGLGLVRVMGLDLRYVGLSPDGDPTAETSGGIKITSQNSTFQGLNQVPFDRSIQCKDPTTGEWFFPAETDTSWLTVEYEGIKFVPPLPPEAEPATSRKADNQGPSEEDRKKKAEADKKAKDESDAKAKAKADEDEKAKKR